MFGNYLHKDRNLNPIVISGSPRSGTSWLAESIAQIFATKRLLWEPLQDGNMEKDGLGFTKRPFLEGNTVTVEMENFFIELMNAVQVNSHLLRLGKRYKNIPGTMYGLVSNQRLIIKFVGGNGVVGYLKRRFNIPKPAIIIRHPCAVIASQLKIGKWEDHPYVDIKLIEKYPNIDNIINIKANLANRLAMTWAADVLAAKYNQDDVHIIYYEDLVINPRKVLSSILRSWEMETLPDDLDITIKRKSSTAKEWSKLDSIHDMLERWKHDLDNKTIDSILRIVHEMGVDDYRDGPVSKYASCR